MVLTLADAHPGAGARYRGTLDERHWQAVVRVAVGAHPATAWLPGPGTRHLEAMGASLLDEMTWSPAIDEPSVVSSRARRRLPLTLALGARHVLAAQGELGTSDDAAVRFGAALHAGAAVIDFIVDETDAGDDLRSAMGQELIDSFFLSEPDWLDHLSSARAQSVSPLTGLVLDLLDNCNRDAQALACGPGAAAHWAPLHRLVADLTRTELGGEGRPTLTRIQRSRLTSVGLSQALGEIALLSRCATAASERPARASLLRHRMERLGEVFWVVDDLVDLLEDHRRGHPNAILDASTGCLTDADLYRLASEAAARLAESVEALGAGPVHGLARQVVALWTGGADTSSVVNGSHTPSGADTSRAGDHHRFAASRAAAYLVDTASRGLDLHAHQLRLPRVRHEGRETHDSVVMVRGLLVDALLDARAFGLRVPAWLIDREVMALLCSKHPLVRGGWSYLPTVPELPPDIDDLGQVLQVLARVGGSDLAATGLEGARMAADGQHATGGIATWILDARGTTPADDAVRSYLPIMGGWGVHPEVVANFALGLLTVDPARWARPLVGVGRYLVGTQEPDGVWASKWYADHFYGTFRAVEVLARLQCEPSALAAAVQFLRDRQVDGGWGADGADPLATSLAVLTLRHAVGADDEAVRSGLSRLVELAGGDGVWGARPWIVFPTLDGPVAYGSPVVTTSFCLKALAGAEGAR